jgi:uncharacterized RDD family membrane protein YckC
MNRPLITLLVALASGANWLSAQDPAPAPDTNTLTRSPLEVTVETASKEETEQPVRPSPRPHRRHRNSRDVVAVGNDVRVKAGEEVGDVVVVHGNLSIDGTVNGDLVSVLGHVRLGPQAMVKGNATIVAGGLDADPAATIVGDPTIVGPALFGLGKGLDTATWWIRWPGQWFKHGLAQGRVLPHQFAWSWILAGMALLLYLIVAVLFPRALQTTVGMIDASPGRSLGAGLLGLLAVPALMILLAITGIGLVVVPFLLFGLGIAFVFGKAAVYRFAGQQLGSTLGWGALQKPLLALVIGAVGCYLLYTVPVVGLIVWAAVFALGLGAVLLALFKREAKLSASAAGGVPFVPVPGASVDPARGSAEPAPATALLPRAGFWLRFLATLLDAVLIGLIVGPLLHAPKWFLLVWVLYHISLWSWKGTTIGGIIVGLRIVRHDGSPINFTVALVRSLASFFSAAVLGLGFLWAGWSPDKQSWHDKIAGTVIVKHPRGTSIV